MVNELFDIDDISIDVELFKKGSFDFITCFDGKKHLKQEQALQILTDKTTVEFLQKQINDIQDEIDRDVS